MTRFLIEMLWQHMEWYGFQKIVSMSLIICIVYKFMIYTKDFLQRFSISERCSIPGMKGNASLFYISTIFSLYKQSTPNLPAMCLGLQTLFGICQVYGKNGLFTFKLLFKPVVVFFEPETVEAVLSSPEHIEKSREYRLLRPWIGTGLLTRFGCDLSNCVQSLKSDDHSESSGFLWEGKSAGDITYSRYADQTWEKLACRFGVRLLTNSVHIEHFPRTKWHKHRKLVTPTFHFSILDTFIPVFQKQANVLISKIQSHIQEPWIDIVPLMSLCTLDIICETAMGVSMNLLSGENCDYSDAMHEIERAIMYRMLRPWLYPDIIFYSTPIGRQFKANLRLVHGLNEKVLKQKMELTKTSSFEKDSENHSTEAKVRKPFLELLLENHWKDPSFTEKDIKEHVDTIMFGGHETTATVMSWALYCLGIYPEVQREVQEELDTIFENEMNECISRAVLAKMKYLECLIKETLRLYPVVPFISRENNRSFKVLDHTVSEGTICLVFISALHRDPVSFPDPEKFDPKRFLTENCVGRHPYAYIPFSAGPRNCVGQKFGMMEAKTILACVLRRFRVIALDPRDKVLTYANILIRNVHPLRLCFVPR